MAKSCPLCRAKAKIRCDKCKNEFCHDHAIKCPTCGTITCIRDLGRHITCPQCEEKLEICPECLIAGKLVRTIKGANICPECGWNG
ncbi:MAG: hypothetical protein BAJATHORv1_30214 [Candidatus Thorarchaeota archaeon]|nr:MAG: hypothetical protein BAJATHORv1_30214 [Candidatus Thorarchaeota archaeon]